MSNEKTNIEVTLLSKEDIDGKSKVLQKVGIGCGEYYWTSTPSYFNYWSGAEEFVVSSSGEFIKWGSVDGVYGVRPVLKSDNLEELIKHCKSEIKNGVQIIECGEYPNLFEEVKINNPSLLRKTGKEYSFPLQDTFPARFTLVDFPEYGSNGQKVIEINKKYYPVKPVKFYVDIENSMLISTNVLFFSPINVESYNETYSVDFKTSQLYCFLNGEFIKSLMPEEQLKAADEENNIPDFMTQSVELEDIDEDKKSLIELIEDLIRINEALQTKSEAISRELEELKTSVQGRTYVKKIK